MEKAKEVLSFEACNNTQIKRNTRAEKTSHKLARKIVLKLNDMG